MRPFIVVSHIIYRTALAARRSRGIWLVGVAGVATLGYVAFSNLGLVPDLATPGAHASGRTDCADTVMGAIADASVDSARAAYHCMNSTVSHQMSEDEFVSQVRQSGSNTTASSVTRVGQETTPDGGRIVFFTLTLPDGALGYIVYLDSNGKVIKME